MRVLVGMEFSGIVREAFAARGHDAWSCDLLETEIPGQHIVGDAIKVIRSRRWDLIILHPPCTALCVSGNRWYGRGQPKYKDRIEALVWTGELWNRAKQMARSVCLENPVGVLNKLTDLPKPQYIQPWMFGHGETKKTGLWLHGLPELAPTKLVAGREPRVHHASPGPDRWKERSRTLPGIADAMATQWG